VEEAAPESTGWALLAVAEQGPVSAALVVLGTRQGQRQEKDMAFVRQAAGVLGEDVGPVRIVDELAPGETMRGVSSPQARQRSKELMRDLVETGTQLEELLVFGDVPAVRVIEGKGPAFQFAVRLAPKARRRQELGVGGDG